MSDLILPLAAAPAPATRPTQAGGGLDAYAIFDAIADIVCITGLDGTLRFLNRAGRDLLGFAIDDVALAGTIFPVHTPAARALLLDEVIGAAIATGEVTVDTALQAADGRQFPATQTVLAPRDTELGGDPVLTIIIRNVGIERHVTPQVAESQRLFELIARRTPDLMYLYDPADERLVWVNRCVHAFLGGVERDARTLSRRELLRLVHPADRRTLRESGARMTGAYGEGDVVGTAFRARTPGGIWRWMHTRLSVFSRRESGEPLLMVGVTTDITAQKRAEERLEAARDAASASAQLAHDFVARLGSEVRAVLHAVAGNTAEVLADRDRRLTTRELSLLSQVMDDSARLLGVASDVGDYAAIEAGGLVLVHEPTDLAQLLRTAVAAFADHPAASWATITTVLPAGTARLLTDPSRLRQALSQLLGEVLLTTRRRLTVALVTADDGALPAAIEILADVDGPVEFLADAPAPFPAQGSCAEQARARGGDGLGLALTHVLCETLGCHLQAAVPTAGGGCAFRIVLPAPSKAARLAAEFPAQPGLNVSGNAGRENSVL
ncbi:MAG: PAS domain S-box protein [Gemmatimonadaceae bacterium]|nr:PAS domain S-box protein [Gemmatimonadaceae bacterium]